MEPFEADTPRFAAGERVVNRDAFLYQNGTPDVKRVPRGRRGTITRMDGPHLAVVVDDTGRTWMQSVWGLDHEIARED